MIHTLYILKRWENFGWIGTFEVHLQEMDPALIREIRVLAKVFMVHAKLSFSATQFRMEGKTHGAVG